MSGALDNHLYTTKILHDLSLNAINEQDKLVEIERL
jgi:hypothetical protein